MFGPLLSLPGVHSESRPARHLLSIWLLHYLMLSILAAHAEPNHLGNKISRPPTPQYLREVKF